MGKIRGDPAPFVNKRCLRFETRRPWLYFCLCYKSVTGSWASQVVETQSPHLSKGYNTICLTSTLWMKSFYQEEIQKDSRKLSTTQTYGIKKNGNVEISIYLTPCSGKQLAQEKAEDSICSEFYQHTMHNLNAYGEDYAGSLVRVGRFGFLLRQEFHTVRWPMTQHCLAGFGLSAGHLRDAE